MARALRRRANGDVEGEGAGVVEREVEGEVEGDGEGLDDQSGGWEDGVWREVGREERR